MGFLSTLVLEAVPAAFCSTDQAIFVRRVPVAPVGVSVVFAGVWTCQANSRIHSWHLSSIHRREGLDKTVCTVIESGVCCVVIGLALVRMTGHSKRSVLQTDVNCLLLSLKFFLHCSSKRSNLLVRSHL